MDAAERLAIQTARSMLDLGHTLDAILASGLVPKEMRPLVVAELQRDQAVELRPTRVILGPDRPHEWLSSIDRSTWYYWPTLRQYLLTKKIWDLAAVRSLDDASDRVLRLLRPPAEDRFDVRGLVLGFVQSGKTANFTALCAKAADVGYRLIIVLSGLDNGLRRQTNIRLKKELSGFADGRVDTVPLPPSGLRWHEFTRPEVGGDFNPGFANHAALQGSQPVLLVVKKSGPVLRRVLAWLGSAPQDVRRSMATLVIDDEADLASVDTRGSNQGENEPLDADYEAPSVINGLIRQLLASFARCSYVAYTATPFANILIPHDTWDPTVGNDLYPKDFIVDLPKPIGYFGAEEIFGRADPNSGDIVGGLDCLREVDDATLLAVGQADLPELLQHAILDFVLAGAARTSRSGPISPATMLVHTSHLIANHGPLRDRIEHFVHEIRDEWRYQRTHGIVDRLRERWDAEFRPVTRASHLERDVAFEAIEPHIGPFLQAVQVLEVNSYRGDILDYDREPSLKAIAVGGNRLSRGLTLEGLLTSFFVRKSATYDTLMQMERWCGFRGGYEDLTRIYTTRELAGWFSDLAGIEHRLREDIQVYEEQKLTPFQVGTRIWQHPAMQVTSPLKRRFATQTTVSQSYRLSLEQTFRFPLSKPQRLADQADANVLAVRKLAVALGDPTPAFSGASEGPVWLKAASDHVLRFLRDYDVDDDVRSLSLPLISAYIERCVASGELTEWTVAVRGLAKTDRALGSADWGLPTGKVSLISRTRLGFSDSIGALVDPKHEGLGLAGDLTGIEARKRRPHSNGLLVIYPVSRHSGHSLVSKPGGKTRQRLFEDSTSPLARDLVGIAFSFPDSRDEHAVSAYLKGTAPDADAAAGTWIPES